MKIIELQSPRPRRNALKFKRYNYPTDKVNYLPIPAIPPPQNFIKVMTERRTRRNFHPLNLNQISSLLWFSAKTRERKHLLGDHWWEHRPTPSAGGCHSVDIWIYNALDLGKQWWVYDNLSHSIARISGVEPRASARTLREISKVIPPGEATIMWFVSQFKKTAARYHHPESLLWRDAGALLATVLMTAEALSLSACPMGITGDSWLSYIIPNFNDSFLGVGGCLIG